MQTITYEHAVYYFPFNTRLTRTCRLDNFIVITCRCVYLSRPVNNSRFVKNINNYYINYQVFSFIFAKTDGLFRKNLRQLTCIRCIEKLCSFSTRSFRKVPSTVSLPPECPAERTRWRDPAAAEPRASAGTPCVLVYTCLQVETAQGSETVQTLPLYAVAPFASTARRIATSIISSAKLIISDNKLFKSGNNRKL